MFVNKFDKDSLLAKSTRNLGVTMVFMLGSLVINQAFATTIQKYPILDSLQSQGKPLAKETTKWMKRWRGIDLDKPEFAFKELSGSTAINMKVQKLDSTDHKGYKAYGSFVPRSGSANFNTEIAYFNLAAILGHDNIFRPAVRYAIGPRAKQSFKLLLAKTPIKGENRLINKANILKELAKNTPLNGCLKADKINTTIAYDAIANIPAMVPRLNTPIMTALQANKPQPVAGKKIELATGYTGDALALAREYSIIMTLDVLFQQWDRYSGANVAIVKNKSGVAHFYMTDNGGAGFTDDNKTWVKNNLNWFSRYDREMIGQLKVLYAFLSNPSKGFMGYTSAEKFVVDLGLYTELTPANYVEKLKQNLQLLLSRVAANERKFGNGAYFLK